MQLEKKGIFKKKVWGFHCDVYQHVNNARYLEFLEEARWEFIQKLNDHVFFKNKIWMTIIVHLEVAYKKPLVLADEIEIYTTIGEVGKKSMTFSQQIYKEEGKTLCTEASFKFVIFDNKAQKTIFIDDEIKRLFNV